MRARLVVLLPGVPFLGGPPAATLASSVEDIQAALDHSANLKVDLLGQLNLDDLLG